MGWGSTFGVFYCSSLILRRYDVCLLRRQCLISYFILWLTYLQKAEVRLCVALVTIKEAFHKPILNNSIKHSRLPNIIWYAYQEQVGSFGSRICGHDALLLLFLRHRPLSNKSVQLRQTLNHFLRQIEKETEVLTRL